MCIEQDDTAVVEVKGDDDPLVLRHALPLFLVPPDALHYDNRLVIAFWQQLVPCHDILHFNASQFHGIHIRSKTSFPTSCLPIAVNSS